MNDEQMKELAELRVAIQDLKYHLIQNHKLQAEIETLKEKLKIAEQLERTIDIANYLKKASEK